MPDTRNRQYGALLRAVEKRIRAFIGDSVPDGNKPGTYCGITAPPGRPPTWAGNYWYSVFHRGMVGNSRQPTFHDRVYGVGVCLSVRVNAKPNDRIGNAAILELNTGLADRVDALADHLHGSYELLHDANLLMRSAQVNDVDVEQGFVETLLFQSATDPQEQGPMWFGGDPTKATGPAPAGLSVTLNFGGARYAPDNPEYLE